MVDEKQNKLIGFSAPSYHGGAEGGGALCGKCNENDFREVGDNLFEFKTTSDLTWRGSGLDEGPFYHYLQINNGQLIALPEKRKFSFTKYVKMDDSYVNGCYVINNKVLNQMPVQSLQFMKNEIYASYGYKFKKQYWQDIFSAFRNDDKLNANVDDSLTAIDKYNIAWINNKLKTMGGNTVKAK